MTEAIPIETIYGDTKGLKPSQVKQLRRIYHERLPADCIVTPEFAQRLAAASTDLNQPLCAYVNRRGQVIRVGVGSPRQTQIPLVELPRYGAERLCGIRCIATDLREADEQPTMASLTALALQRLDALVMLHLTGTGKTKRGGGATGYVASARIAQVVPLGPIAASGDSSDSTVAIAVNAAAGALVPVESPAIAAPVAADPEVSPVPGTAVGASLSLAEIEELDFIEFVGDLEADLERAIAAQPGEGDGDRVLLVGIQTGPVDDRAFEERLTELRRLVETAGGEAIDTMVQKRSRLHPQTAIGEGKVDEIALQAQTIGANLIAFDRDLSPAQVRNLEQRIGVRVVDRTEVILDIFAQRAQSGEGKVQVELAQLEYQMPRLVGRGQAMSRLGGGIGTRGPGETKLETERRLIQKRIARLQREVTELQAHRSRLRQKRQNRDVPVAAIVGYTNAGKSTLLNHLTSAEVYAADQLFATLDPTTRRLTIYPPDGGTPQQLLLTDTVGFIQELPPPLVDAFRATLEEVTEADVLIHLVDLSHPSWGRHIATVEGILGEMPTVPGPSLLVFNKIDAAPSDILEQARQTFPHAAFISARDRLGFDTFRQRLCQLVDAAGLA
ncbi:MAG: GTPase HflX [Cyanobacteria bacterium]|nr:GTPase HflX [Cyanobacteriota bacterium]